jgi:hypothetical protein
MAAAKHFPADGAADEAGTAGDQDLFWQCVPRSGLTWRVRNGWLSRFFIFYPAPQCFFFFFVPQPVRSGRDPRRLEPLARSVC